MSGASLDLSADAIAKRSSERKAALDLALMDATAELEATSAVFLAISKLLERDIVTGHIAKAKSLVFLEARHSYQEAFKRREAIRQDIKTEGVTAFLADLGELSRRHNVVVGGYGYGHNDHHYHYAAQAHPMSERDQPGEYRFNPDEGSWGRFDWYGPEHDDDDF